MTFSCCRQFPLTPAGFRYLCVTSPAPQRHCFSQNKSQDSQSLGDAAFAAELDDREGIAYSLLLQTLCHDIENLAQPKLVSLQRGNPFLPSAVHSQERKMFIQLLK